MANDENEEELEELTISKGTIIHLNSIPFELSEDTKVFGLQSNLDFAFNQDKTFSNQSEQFLLSPCQATSFPKDATRSLSFPSMHLSR